MLSIKRKDFERFFGELAPLVVDELISAMESGYDYDKLSESPFYDALKIKLAEI